MTGIVSTVLYLLIVFSCFGLSKSYSANNRISNETHSNLSLPLVLVFSSAFTIFNIFCTSNETEWRGDRLQYFRDYNGRKVDSFLSFIIDFVKYHFDSFELLLYSTTFICCMLIFLAYRNSKQADAYCLLAFMCTDTILYSYTRLKQAYAIAIAILLLTIVMNNQLTIKRLLVSVLLLYILCGFHVSGYIMIPLFIFIWLFKDKKINIYLVLLIILILFISFQPFLIGLAKIIEPILPGLTNKINDYFTEDSLKIGEGSLLYFIKGIPYYFFLISGLLCRKKLSSKIQNYDIYLTIVMCCSLSFVISLWSYWMKRTSAYFCFASIEFGITLIRNFDNNKLRMYSYYSVLFYFAFLLIRYFYQSFSIYGGLI